MIRCPKLVAPSHGSMQSCSNLLGRTCQFSCSKGYQMLGSRSRTCQSNGEWTGSETDCQGMKRFISWCCNWFVLPKYPYQGRPSYLLFVYTNNSVYGVNCKKKNEIQRFRVKSLNTKSLKTNPHSLYRFGVYRHHKHQFSVDKSEFLTAFSCYKPQHEISIDGDFVLSSPPRVPCTETAVFIVEILC